jgi:translation initiation factor 1A
MKKEHKGGFMGKRKVKSENYDAVKLPAGNDIIGIAKKMLGNDRVLVSCQDGHERICRIRGKMKRRMWIRVGDIVLVSPWDFQSDNRGDIIWRYKRNQAEWLRRKGYLKTY